MPVYLEWVQTPSEQDKVDLDKLYHDAPSEWLSLIKQSSGQDYVDYQLQQGFQVAAGRFNDRLLVAAVVKSESDEQGDYCQLDQLCVRNVTRERGVAKQLMVRLCQWADEQGIRLKVSAIAQDNWVLTQFGFNISAGCWQRMPK